MLSSYRSGEADKISLRNREGAKRFRWQKLLPLFKLKM